MFSLFCRVTFSFASGGDSDSLDYIAYVAKDNAGNHICLIDVFANSGKFCSKSDYRFQKRKGNSKSSIFCLNADAVPA
jgi:hypothetical protein